MIDEARIDEARIDEAPVDETVRDERSAPAPARDGHRSAGPWTPATLVAPAVAGALALMAIALEWRGSDLPAHFFRVGLVERHGLTAWNNYWFGGHHTIGYGVLFPVLGAAFGIWTVAVLSAMVSAALADAVIRCGTGRRHWPATLWFAAGTLTNVAVGRLPFALGLTIALGAVLAAQHRRYVAASVLVALTAIASPVVSVFLVIVAAGWALTSTGRDRRSLALLVPVAIAPVLVLAALFPQGGTFPFRWGALVWTLVVCAVVVALVPARHTTVRLIAVLFGLAAVAAFMVQTPLGANITRFGMYAAGPVLLALVPFRRGIRGLVLLGIVPVVWFWQWSPSFDAIVRANDDLSTDETYYQPLLEFLREQPGEVRVEVVPTSRHWEAAYVAAEFPIARGWERQLDQRFHAQFYEDGHDQLSVSEYWRWLRSNGVRFVALADAPLDRSGEREAEIVAREPWYLHEVWSSDHWRLFAVVDSTGLVDGPAVVTDLSADSATLAVLDAGDVVVRVRASAFWAADPPVCIEPTPDGWIVLRDVRPGDIELVLDEPEVVPEGADPCAATDGAPAGEMTRAEETRSVRASR